MEVKGHVRVFLDRVAICASHYGANYAYILHKDPIVDKCKALWGQPSLVLQHASLMVGKVRLLSLLCSINWSFEAFRGKNLRTAVVFIPINRNI